MTDMQRPTHKHGCPAGANTQTRLTCTNTADLQGPRTNIRVQALDTRALDTRAADLQGTQHGSPTLMHACTHRTAVPPSCMLAHTEQQFHPHACLHTQNSSSTLMHACTRSTAAPPSCMLAHTEQQPLPHACLSRQHCSPTLMHACTHSTAAPPPCMLAVAPCQPAPAQPAPAEACHASTAGTATASAHSNMKPSHQVITDVEARGAADKALQRGAGVPQATHQVCSRRKNQPRATPQVCSRRQSATATPQVCSRRQSATGNSSSLQQKAISHRQLIKFAAEGKNQPRDPCVGSLRWRSMGSD